MIGATAGLGFLINYAQYNFLIPKMYAAIITTSALGVAVNYGLAALVYLVIGRVLVGLVRRLD